MTLKMLYFAAGAFVFCSSVFGQARPAPGTPRPVTPAAAPARGVEYLRKVEIVIEKDRTPDYNVSATEGRATIRDWSKITVSYESMADWVDELKVRFYVASKDKSGAYTMFTLEVVYQDVPKGKHTAMAFLTPTVIARYGVPERAGAELFITDKALRLIDQPVGLANSLSGEPWWRAPGAGVAAAAGRLLNRDQTPFAFVAFDNYNDIKQK